MNAPLYPLEGAVSWNMNTVCNYRCSYCTQRFLDDRKQWARDVPGFVQGFLALPGDWEIKLSGGEPFQHPRFIELVAALADGGRRISVVTNLSAPARVIDAYLDATAAKPGVFSASLHLEFTDVDGFVARLAHAASRHAGPVVATCVATRENLARGEALAATFASAGLRLRWQAEKQDRDVVMYTEAERAALVALNGAADDAEIAPSYLGRPCWAGSRYLIVDHRGEAWRCYPARRYKRERLGNILDGTLRLGVQAEPCRYQYCNCSVPIERGMMARSVET